MKKSNILISTATLLKVLKIAATNKNLQKELELHPDFPSIAAISGVFNSWNIPNAVFKIKMDELINIPCPFMVHLSTKRGEFAVVESIHSEYVTVTNERMSKHKIPFQQFGKQFNGTILYAEKAPDSGEPGYNQMRRNEILDNIRIPFVITAAICMLMAIVAFHSSYLNSFTTEIGLLTFFKTIGLVTSVLLLIQSIDSNNSLIQKLCSGDNNKDCNAILSSKASKITENLNWSEVGFFYFAGSWLTLLFNTTSDSLIHLLAFLNLISLPYTFYSIYYQARIAKQWCVFCCIIQVLLWMEFFCFLPDYHISFILPTVSETGNLLVSFILPITVWVFIKPYLAASQKVEPLNKQLRDFKYNREIFDRLLLDNTRHTLLDDVDSLILGNREAEKVITIVSSPYCPPCSKVHKLLDELLLSRDDLQVQIVFATNNHPSDPKTQLAAHVLTLKDELNEQQLNKAISDWYNQKTKNYETWAKAYPKKDGPSKEKILEKQWAWSKNIEIEGTPTILINGRKLPKPYRPEDIKYFI
jgi:uncharacterized membrane protein